MLPIELPHATGERADAKGGVWSSSSPEQYVIFAADTVGGYGTVGNVPVWLAAHGIGFKALRGSWEGIEEPSYIINARDWPRVYWLALDQQCVLHLGTAYDPVTRTRRARPATLYNQDGTVTPIGRFVAASEAEAKASIGWTYDPTEDQYYVVI